MAEVISVRFKEVGKNYYFDPKNITFKRGDKVIVETARGLEFGEVTIANREIPDEEITTPLKPVMRVATEKDFATVEENKSKEKAAFDICLQKIRHHKLHGEGISADRNKTVHEFKILKRFLSAPHQLLRKANNVRGAQCRKLIF